MLPKVLKKTDLAAWVAALMAEQRVAGPVRKEFSPSDGHDLFGWAYLVEPADLRLDYNVTVLGPKKFLWPSRQTLYAYSLKGDPAPEAVIEHEPTVLFGVHPCDVTAIQTTDAAFGKDIADPHYLARRADTAIVGIDCGGPCDDQSSFCLDMGSLYPEAGYDVMLTDLGDAYFLDIKTEKGQAIAEAANAKPASKADHTARTTFTEKKRASFHNKLPCEVKYLPEILDASYDSLVWEAIARRCFSCGSCNTVCPTCYCFDVYDDVAMDLSKGCRVRRYDSCQLDPFATVAGGENFREHRWSRLRHRMFRKGKYIVEQTGKSGCVGCGRCERACVAAISIRETFTQIAGSR